MGGGMGGPQGGMMRDHGHGMGDIGIGNRAMDVPTHPTGPQLGLPGRWWDERSSIKSLSLRKDQKQKMDEIFNGSKGTLLNSLDNLQREEDKLSSMSQKDRQDESKVMAAMQRVEEARAELAREIIHMQVQIRQQLDPDQLNKLDAAIANQH
jgi:Spy/CpxP family protein refolding chaperone